MKELENRVDMATVCRPVKREVRGKQEKHAGMGCLPHEEGVAFRVWAPHADRISVAGEFNQWREQANLLEAEDGGLWYTDVRNAKIGDEYRYIIWNGRQKLSRMDPCSHEVTNSVGNSVVHDPAFDWESDNFRIAPFNELVIYEMHVGTFSRSRSNTPGTFEDVTGKLDYLQGLGVNCIQLMPTAEFAGDISWGYNPAHIYAVESIYGGPLALKELVKRAHQHGIAVVLDVVYNHFGPSDLNIWQFDGWSENAKGGIYFYTDERSNTPWGDSRPDYGRPEVRTYIRDNAMMWVDEYHMDGLRYDMTLFMRSIDGKRELPDGWSLAQWINRDVHFKFPHKIMIAEDMQDNDWLTKPVDAGGAGFSAQWDAEFVHPIRNVIERTADHERSMYEVRDALCHRYNFSAFERVIYSESHDEVGNGKQRVPSEIDPKNPEGWYAQKRSTLAASLVYTVPGIPMIFQGQELLNTGGFDDSQAIDWSNELDCRGIVRLYRDLIRLRLNRDGSTVGLTGQRIECHHLNDNDKVIAFRRWKDGGRGDDTIVVANFANREWSDYRIGFIREGPWQLRFNSDAGCYSKDFANFNSQDVVAEGQPYDGLPASGSLKIAPYTVLVFSERID
jgi:1,4-alpha-glucan branching enzyme